MRSSHYSCTLLTLGSLNIWSYKGQASSMYHFEDSLVISCNRGGKLKRMKFMLHDLHTFLPSHCTLVSFSWSAFLHHELIKERRNYVTLIVLPYFGSSHESYRWPTLASTTDKFMTNYNFSSHLRGTIWQATLASVLLHKIKANSYSASWGI